jgi:thymidylate synthase (FAD)
LKVELIDHMGSDLSVVNAARVSFDKESQWETLCPCGSTGPCFTSYCRMDNVLSERDRKLIKYLDDHNHWSPFAHATVSFRVKAPIFVARQLEKHQVGLAWNEVSRRYVDFEPEFFEPEVWRKRAASVKQGSSDQPVELLAHEGDQQVRPLPTWAKGEARPSAVYKRFIRIALELYQEKLDSGVCPEQARMVLPQSMMTEWIWTGSLAAFGRVGKQRLDPHTQLETQWVAQQISTHMARLFPESWAALTEN